MESSKPEPRPEPVSAELKANDGDLQPASSPKATARANKPSILIVDDDASFVDATAVFLLSHGYRPIKAYSGRQAIREVQRLPVDLAMIDLYLPDLNGLNVARELRRTRPSTTIIMISSDDSDEAIRCCMEAGAGAFLAKPLPPRELLLRIGESVTRHTMAR